MQEKFSDKVEHIRSDVQELLQMMQVLDLVIFIGFFNDLYFRVSNTIFDLKFKMLA